MIGALLTGVFAYGPLTATSAAPQGVNIGGLPQFESQCIAVASTLIWSGGISFILLKLIDATMGLRVDAEAEREGLDITLHGEQLG
jgi:Amt family ammonium transporter